MTPLVSVVLPCRNEARYLGACLDSILATTYPRDRLEVLVVDGASNDGTRAVAAGYAAVHPPVRLVDNPDRIVPTAMNLGIRAARGEIIVRMDAHVLYPPEYLPKLVAALHASGADNVGGRLVTLPADASPRARAIAFALSHPLGVGNAHFRIGVARPRWVDTVPFGCFRAEVFRRIGGYDEDLVRNQDDELNFRLRRRGGRILLLPDVVAFYYARGTARTLARMFYQYGYYKPLVGRKVGRVMTARQLAPPAFVLGLTFGAVAGALWTPAALLWTGLAATYLLLITGTALLAARRLGARCALWLLVVFPTLHLSYGCGFLNGLRPLLSVGRRRGPDPATVPLSR